MFFFGCGKRCQSPLWTISEEQQMGMPFSSDAMDFPSVNRDGIDFYVVGALLDMYESTIPRSTLLRQIGVLSPVVLATPTELLFLKQRKLTHARANRCQLVHAGEISPFLRTLGGDSASHATTVPVLPVAQGDAVAWMSVCSELTYL